MRKEKGNVIKRLDAEELHLRRRAGGRVGPALVFAVRDDTVCRLQVVEVGRLVQPVLDGGVEDGAALLEEHVFETDGGKVAEGRLGMLARPLLDVVACGRKAAGDLSRVGALSALRHRVVLPVARGVVQRVVRHHFPAVRGYPLDTLDQKRRMLVRREVPHVDRDPARAKNIDVLLHQRDALAFREGICVRVSLRGRHPPRLHPSHNPKEVEEKLPDELVVEQLRRHLTTRRPPPLPNRRQLAVPVRVAVVDLQRD
mmetsp:Transcript_61766/g.147041  ORF Transcript_61766/g.147041 Transcript_61766/m.147041 type:complete len:256 (-) Transcript_61766:1756-2523(-)